MLRSSRWLKVTLQLSNTLLQTTRAERERIATATLATCDPESREDAKASLSKWVAEGPTEIADSFPAQQPIEITWPVSFKTPTLTQLIALVKSQLPEKHHTHFETLIAGAQARRRADFLREEIALRAIANHDVQEAQKRFIKAEEAYLKHKKLEPNSEQQHAEWSEKLRVLLREKLESQLAVSVLENSVKVHLERLQEDAKKSSLYGVVQWGLTNSWAVASVLSVIIINVMIWMYRGVLYLFGVSTNCRLKAIARDVKQQEQTAKLTADNTELIASQLKEVRARMDAMAEELVATRRELVKQAERAATPVPHVAPAPEPTSVSLKGEITVLWRQIVRVLQVLLNVLRGSGSSRRLLAAPVNPASAADVQV
jgi:hypothetical protein